MQDKKFSLSLSRLPKLSSFNLNNEIGSKTEECTPIKSARAQTSFANVESQPFSYRLNIDRGSARTPDIININKEISNKSSFRGSLSNFDPSSLLSKTNEKFFTEKEKKNGVPMKSSSSDHIIKDFYLTNLLETKSLIKQSKRKKDSNEIKEQYQQSNNIYLVSDDGNNVLKPPSSESTNRNNESRSNIDLNKVQVSRGTKIYKYFDNLPASLRVYYIDKKDYLKLFDDADVAIYCLEEITDRVKCYRCELGTTLEKLELSFKKIIEKILDLNIKYMNDRDQTYEKRMKENLEGLKKFNIEKLKLEEKNKQYKTLLNVQDSEVKIYQINMKSMENEINLLHELLKKDYLLNQKGPLDDLNFPATGEFKAQTVNKSEPKPNELLEKGLENLQESIFNLEKEQHSKGGILQSMNNLLKAMLKGRKNDAHTQVEEGELGWKLSNIVNEEIMLRASDYNNYDKMSVNIESNIKESIHKNRLPEDVDPLDILKIKEKEKEKERLSETTLTNEEMTNTITQSTQKDQILAKINKNTKNESNNAYNNQADSYLQQWNLPIHMLVFLENTTKDGDTANVLPWSYFRKLIFDIYNDRWKHNSEIVSSLQGSCIQMSEFTCLYFLKVFTS